MANKNRFANRIKMPPIAELQRRLGIAPNVSDVVTGSISTQQSNIANLSKPTPKVEMKVQPAQDSVQKSSYSVQVIDVTPSLAREMLERNQENRPLSQKRVDEYAQTMAMGRWLLNPQPVIVSVRNYLLDGQHRLHAVVKSGCTVKMSIAYNVPDEVFTTIDRGVRRSPAQILGLFYDVSNPQQVNARCITIRNIEDPIKIAHNMEAPEVFEMYKRFKKAIDWSLDALPSRCDGGAPFAGAMAFAYKASPTAADEFVDRVQEREDINKQHPAYWLCKLIDETPLNSEINRRLVAVATLRAFYAFINGEKMQQLKANMLMSADSQTLASIVSFFKRFNDAD